MQGLDGSLVIAEFASYLSPMKTLLLFIGTVLRSRIIQRKGFGAIPAIYKLIQYWWTWTPPQIDDRAADVSEHHEQPSAGIATERVNAAA